MLLQKCQGCGKLTEDLTSTIVPLGEGSCGTKDICSECQLDMFAKRTDKVNQLNG